MATKVRWAPRLRKVSKVADRNSSRPPLAEMRGRGHVLPHLLPPRTQMLAAAALIITTALGIPSLPPRSLAVAPAPKNGDELIRAMHQRYAGKWYSTLTFVQKTTYPDGHIETWYESLRIPGSLRIDIAPLDSGKAILFRNDSIWIMKGGKSGPGQSLIHPLMVLGC